YERYGARGKIEARPTETLKITLAGDYLHSYDDATSVYTSTSQTAYPTGTVTTSAPLAAFLSGVGITPSASNRQASTSFDTHVTDKNYGGSLTGELELGDYTVTSITAYREWKNHQFQDNDGLSALTATFPQIHDEGKLASSQFSQELRLTSPKGNFIDYVVGAYYMRAKTDETYERTVTRLISGSEVPVTGVADYGILSKNYAVFGEANFNFTSWLRAFAGYRSIWDDLSFYHERTSTNDPTNSGASSLDITSIRAYHQAQGSTSQRGDSYRGGIQLDVTPTTHAYFTYARGYKGPAFNVFFNHTAPTNSQPIDPEKSNSFEVGFKSQWFDRIVQLNAAAFLVDYKGFQANNFVLLNGAVVTNLTNAGTVRSKGFEADLTVAPTEGLTFRANAAYADARVRRFNPNPLTNAPDARDGTRLPLAPKFSYTIGADYDVPVGPVKLYLSSDWHHVSKQFSDLGESGEIDPYGIWNASIGVSDAEDKYRLTFMVRNILDDSYVLLNTSAGQRLMIPRDADRYAGLNLRAKFN
ncbi:MAG: TonB-dependent receptor, partial [Micrococcales bacterium]|nr:TonB-dependent receptor [Micrococcales bacterium]